MPIIPCADQYHMWNPWQERCSGKTAGPPWCDRPCHWYWPWCAGAPHEAQTPPSVAKAEFRFSAPPGWWAAGPGHGSAATQSLSSDRNKEKVLRKIWCQKTETLRVRELKLTAAPQHLTCVLFSLVQKSWGKTMGSYRGERETQITNKMQNVSSPEHGLTPRSWLRTVIRSAPVVMGR